jgi:hypothetical protein
MQMGKDKCYERPEVSFNFFNFKRTLAATSQPKVGEEWRGICV